MDRGTANQQLAELILGEPVAEFIARRRPKRSWRLIARDLHEATDGRVDVTPETVRAWSVNADVIEAVG